VALNNQEDSHIWILPQGQTAQAKQVTSGETPDDGVAAGPAGKLLVRSRGSEMVLMNADGTDRTVVRPNLRNYLSMSSCGDRYLLFDSIEENKLRLMRTDPDGSNSFQLTDDVLYSDCSPDGKWILFATAQKLYRIPIEGGAPVELFTASGGLDGTISPDGKWIACFYQTTGPVVSSKFGVIPAEGGAPVHDFIKPIGAQRIHWSPDQKSIQFLLTRHGATNVWEQPLVGGPPRPVTNFTSGHIFDFAWTHDGKQLLLAKGEETSDVVLVSNFR
jgi:Tol biopolymer transport system component